MTNKKIQVAFGWRARHDEEGHLETLNVRKFRLSHRNDDVLWNIGSLHKWVCHMTSNPDCAEGRILRIPLRDVADWKLLLPNALRTLVCLVPIRRHDGSVRVLLSFSLPSDMMKLGFANFLLLQPEVKDLGSTLNSRPPVTFRVALRECTIIDHLVFDDPSLIDVVIP